MISIFSAQEFPGYGASLSPPLYLAPVNSLAIIESHNSFTFLLGEAVSERMAQRHVGASEPTHHPCDTSSHLKCNRHTKQRRGR